MLTQAGVQWCNHLSCNPELTQAMILPPSVWSGMLASNFE